MRHCGCCCSFDWIKVVKLHIHSKKHGGHLALVVRGLDLPREAREAHEPAAAVPPTPKDGNAPALGSLLRQARLRVQTSLAHMS